MFFFNCKMQCKGVQLDNITALYMQDNRRVGVKEKKKIAMVNAPFSCIIDMRSAHVSLQKNTRLQSTRCSSSSESLRLFEKGPSHDTTLRKSAPFNRQQISDFVNEMGLSGQQVTGRSNTLDTAKLISTRASLTSPCITVLKIRNNVFASTTVQYTRLYVFEKVLTSRICTQKGLHNVCLIPSVILRIDTRDL